ncbi:MAG: N-acetylmuramoyl-L-alanine amidase [Endomicrobiales bacterium]|nr:N-acetylmuramoyl-L-alanine amidase [Endomicrobiales bacterium]
MKKLDCLALTCFLLFSCSGAAVAEDENEIVLDAAFAFDAAVSTRPALGIMHPYENARLSAPTSTYVCGWALPGGALTINGQSVPVDPGGGYLAMVNLSSGAFAIDARLEAGATVYTLTRTVLVRPPSLPSPVYPTTIECVAPETDYTVVTGDEIPVSAKGSPGAEAYFTVKGVSKRFAMMEIGRGIYRGVYVVRERDKLKKSKITVTLSGKNKKSRRARGVVWRLPGPQPLVAEVSADDTILRAGPAPEPGNRAGFYLCVPKGTLLRVTGAIGDELRVRLAKNKEAWVKRASVRILPKGAPPGRGIARDMLVTAQGSSTEIRVPLGSKIPFEFVPDVEGKYLDAVLYGAYSNIDFIKHVSTGAVEQVKWYQDDSETLRVRAYTPKVKWWGYDASYDGESELVISIFSPQPAPKGAKGALAGLTIAVDAGHSPDNGAVGCTGLVEKDVNIEIAKKLQKKLADSGAKVVMTREGDEPVALYDRPKKARKSGADLYISVHNNALSYGGNPFEKNGYEIYYYNPLSLALARCVHAAYGELIGPDAAAEYKLRDGGVIYGNYAVTRTYQMPAVLTESAYMIVPREEAFLKTEKFQNACAEAMAKGITKYVESMRVYPQERRAAPPKKTSKSGKKNRSPH